MATSDLEGVQVELVQPNREGVEVVFFYPQTDFPPSAALACALRDELGEWCGKGLRIVGVSADSAENQREFKERNRLPFVFISDADLQVARAFGVTVSYLNMKIGRERTRIPVLARQIYVIKDGRVAWADKNPQSAAAAVEKVREYLPRGFQRISLERTESLSGK